jgi:hypothetical protein
MIIFISSATLEDRGDGGEREPDKRKPDWLIA